MNLFYLFLSLLPFLFFSLILIFKYKVSLLKISLITLLLTIAIVVFFWHGSLPLIIFSVSRGLLVALDIFFIIFGAILFLEYLKKNKVMDSLAFHLDHFSPDFRVQTIILAWFFEVFLEGIAGFGTPSIVVAPLLIALGISPFNAVLISLLGNSISVPFGAVGTPIRVGLAGINLDQVALGSLSAFFNFIGLIVPVFMLWVLLSRQKNRSKLFFQGLPFALWSGLAFVGPAYLISLFGIEFPSIIGPIIGLFIVIVSSRFGIFVPRPLFTRPDKITISKENILNLKKVILPYAIFIVLLTIGKFTVSSFSIKITSLNYSISLFNPGFIFIISLVIISFFYKTKLSDLFAFSKTAFKKTLSPFLVIASMSATVQLMNYSANSQYQLISMTQTFAQLFQTKFLASVAPFIGAFGSFITGSATVSNLMFASSVYTSSLFMNQNYFLNLSLMLTGAGIGNMIAISDILAAKTVSNDQSSLRQNILSIFPYCLILLVLLAIIGLLI